MEKNSNSKLTCIFFYTKCLLDVLGVLNHSVADTTSNRDMHKEIHVLKDEEEKCNIRIAFVKGFREDLERIMKGECTGIINLRLEVLMKNIICNLI